MARYFGQFRIAKRNATVTCNDGTVKVLPIVSNPIESDGPRVMLNGEKLTRKVADKLYKRDRANPYLTKNIG